MVTRIITTSLLSIFTIAALATQSLAVPTPMIHIDPPGDCDPLFIPNNVHEIGDLIEFPADESLGHMDLGPTNVIPCPILDDTLIPNVLVDIRNTSGIEWHEVWYVADQETTITNFDGEANQAIPGLAPLREAFRIDNAISDPGGAHHPLIFESLTPDGIWEIGESWTFILQDYTNSLGLPASAITSIGVGDASSTPASGVIDSSGSIIAIALPEPASLALFLGSGIGLLSLRRRRV